MAVASFGPAPGAYQALTVPRLSLALVAALVSGGLLAQAAIPVILDTDIGDDIDDALALSLALQSPELRILGITTVLQRGAERAALIEKILQLHGRTEIPVGIGAEQTLMGEASDAPVKQVEALSPAEIAVGARRNGIELIIETCLRSPEKVTLIAYGPLTNIALALRAEPRLRGKIERIVLMNGVFFNAGLEYNTYRDPEAAAIVYGSGFPVSTVGLDVTMQCRLGAEQMDQLQSSRLPTVQFLWKLIQLWNGGNQKQRPILHDPLAIITAVRPDIVSNVRGSVTVETHGKPGVSYGLTAFQPSATGPVSVAKEVRATDAVQFFMERLLKAPLPVGR